MPGRAVARRFDDGGHLSARVEEQGRLARTLGGRQPGERLLLSMPAVAEVPFPLHQVVAYMREHVEATSSHCDVNTMAFESATFEGAPEGQRFDVIVKRTGHTSKVLVARSSNGETAFAEPRLRASLDRNERPIANNGNGPASF